MSVSIISDLATNPVTEKFKVAGKYTFPSYEKIDPAIKKSSEYCRDVARAAYSNLMRDRTALPSDYYTYIQLLRDYGTGNQSWAFYSNRLKDVEPSNTSTQSQDNARDLSGAASTARRGDGNINHKIVSIATNLKNAIHGMFDEYEEDIFVNAVDNESGAEEENAMFEALWDAQNSEFTKEVQQTYGVPIESDNAIPSDVSAEELRTYKETGGFKVAWAESMEELIDFTARFSKWERVLKRKFIDDALDINFMASRVVYDTSSQKERWEYVDPANFVIQYSNDRLFDNAEYAGYFTLEKIGTLVEMGFSSEELVAASRNYEFLFDNPTDIDWGAYERTTTLSDKIFDFKVPVFHFNWIDVDVKRSLQVTNKHDKTYTYDIKFDKEVKPLSDHKKQKGTVAQKVIKTRLKKAYQCSWVIDTNMVYNYGPVPNQARKSKKEAKLSFTVWRGITTNRNMILGSIMESIVPFLDHLQIAWLKYQDSIVKAHPGGYEINLRLLQNLKVGGKKIDPLDAYQMFWDKGVMPYMDVPMGETYKGGDVSPIRRIQGTQGELMSIIQAEIAFVIQMIERVTGINPTTVGASPDNNAPVSTTQMATAGTNNVLKPILSALFEIKEGLATESSRRFDLLFRNVKEARDSYSRIIGDQSVDVIRQAERNGAEYGLYMEARPSGEEKQDLIVMIQEAMKRGRDGEASVNLGQGFYIIERIKNGGNFKKLQRQVDMMIRKSEQEAFEKKRALITEQNQQQASIIKEKQQGDMQVKQMDTESTIAIDNNKSKNTIREMQIEANLDYRNKLIDKRLEMMDKKQEQEAAVNQEELKLT